MLMQEMKTAGVEKAIVPFNNRGKGMSNDDFVKLDQAYPDTFVGFAATNPMHGVEATLEIIDKYVLHGPFRGINFEPGLEGVTWRLDNEDLFPIYELCEKENIPMYMTWGGLVATPNAYEPEYVDHVARKFPNLKMMLAHAGFPRNKRTCVVCMNHPNVYLNVDLYVVNCFGAEDYITAANCRLKNQICFGSAYPYSDINKMVEYYVNCGFKESVLENVMYNNTARFVE